MKPVACLTGANFTLSKGNAMEYKIIAVRGHYEVYDANGKFFCSADTYGEARREIEKEMK